MDFDQFADGTPDVDPTDPVALYKTLERKRSHIELRDSQKELLPLWAKRRGDRDLVLKLTTGAGKTTLGLVVLYSHMVETKRPCLFLCPTNQLVEQVEEEAKKCGVPCIAMKGGGEIPPEVLAGQAVLVTSAQNVFHARAGHFTKVNFYALVIDDAHTAVETIRKQFRVVIDRDDPLFKKLLGLFRDTLRAQSLGTATEIEAKLPSAGGLEVPYWAWLEQRETVTKLLTEAQKADDAAYKKDGSGTGLGLVWGLIKNSLHGTRCVFTNTQIEIAPEIPPVDKLPTLDRAERRIFMSATINDESVLVRELGCSAEAAADPIELPDAGGLGERMILVPRLLTKAASQSMSWDDLAKLCKKLSDGIGDKKYSVVVLTPSKAAAKRWAAVGAKVITETADVPGAVRALRDEKLKFVAFANRYDGLDLPDDACRVLVLDGAPMAQSAIDAIDMRCRGAATTRHRAVMHRIEQGLGRGVRSPADHAVNILFGNDVVTLVSMHETRAELTEQTRRQIEFGLEMARIARAGGSGDASVETLALQCLQRDPKWKKAYANRGAPRPSTPADLARRKARIAQASVERRAWVKYINNQGADAAKLIEDHLNATRPPDPEKAYLIQRAAWYLRTVDPARSLELQKWAREQDAQLLLPSAGIEYRKRSRTTPSAAAQFVEWLSRFDHPNAAIADIDQMRSHLVFSPEAPSEAFEEALKDLGYALGFDSTRPEKEFHVGPDVLWMDGQHCSAVEAKNNTSPDTPVISKDCAGQLTQSSRWAAEVHPERTKHVPIIVHPRTKEGEAAILPPGTRVLTPDHLKGILDALVNVVLAVQRVGDKVSVESAAEKLGEAQLSLEAIIRSRTAKPS